MTFHDYPPIRLPAPLLVLHADTEGLWAGGTGGVAYFANGHWLPRIAGLPLTVIGGLASAEGWIFAGGMEGIARSADDGQHWELAALHGSASGIAAMVTSPAFAQDTAALAATLEGGILRSDDAGQNWTPSNFGLSDFEVAALLWPAAEVVLAGTSGGIYRSPNGGRAWRAVDGPSEPVAALVQRPDGSLIAALEDGGLLLSEDLGASWTPLGEGLPQAAPVMALCATAQGRLLLGTASEGIFASDDGGFSWTQQHHADIFALARGCGGLCQHRHRSARQ